MCRISSEHDDERMYFSRVRDLTDVWTFDDMKADPELKGMEFLANPNGSFFRLTEVEYQRLARTDDEGTPENLNRNRAYTDDDFLRDVYVSSDGLRDMKNLLDIKRNLILQGAPGTGKTYAARRLAYDWLGEADDSRIEFVQFHQNTSYDDFVYGYRPDGNGFSLRSGTFARLCNKASKDPGRRYVFIIDEINRATSPRSSVNCSCV